MSTPWKIFLAVLFIIYRAAYYIIAMRYPEFRFGLYTKPIAAGLATDAAFVLGVLLLFFLRDSLQDIKDSVPKLFLVLIMIPIGGFLMSLFSFIIFFLTI